VSKSPAKKTPPSRKKGSAGKAPAKAAAKRPGAKKPATQKTAARPAARTKSSPKPVAKARPKVKPKTSAKAVPKKAAAKAARPSAPAKASKPAARAPIAPPAAKPIAKPAAKPVAKPAAAPIAPAKTTAPPKPQTAPSPASKSSAKSAAATAAANTRFTERFAPPRPPQRGLPEPIEPVRPVYKIDPKLVNAWKSKAGRDLTEAELMAMPDSEYMNEKQLEFFRVRLQALKDDLLSNAGETTEHLREDTSIVPDPADRATIEEEHALELRTRDRERKLLKKISQSLARIDAGDYGYCDETGEPIGLGRLLARPTATLSLEAQQRRELKQKMFGD
jgi:DnaK suppressor protein